MIEELKDTLTAAGVPAALATLARQLEHARELDDRAAALVPRIEKTQEQLRAAQSPGHRKRIQAEYEQARLDALERGEEPPPRPEDPRARLDADISALKERRVSILADATAIKASVAKRQRALIEGPALVAAREVVNRALTPAVLDALDVLSQLGSTGDAVHVRRRDGELTITARGGDRVDLDQLRLELAEGDDDDNAGVPTRIGDDHEAHPPA